jgi:hypothetical protein
MPSIDPDTVRPLNDICENADELSVDGITGNWTTANATIGAKCNQQERRGPSVWYRFVGIGGRLIVSECDFSSELGSGFNLYITAGGTCDTLKCIIPKSSTSGTTCDTNQDGASVSFRSAVGSVYYVEVTSFSFEQGFNQALADTTGFVAVRPE